MHKFDIVVVGAGTGGCLTAKIAAEAGFEVCLLDRKNKSDIGEKICGDAISKHHFDNLGLPYPAGNELERNIVGVRIYSPDMETVLDFKGKDLHGYIVNRHLFGQRLLKTAIKAGATFYESTQVMEPITKNGFVTGVLAKRVGTRDEFAVHAQVVVDASGILAVLRKKLPPEIGVEANVNTEDFVICYREIRKLKEETRVPDFCELYFNQTLYPGGYAWIFPESGTKVNAGCGVSMSHNFPNPKTQFYNHVLSDLSSEEDSVLSKGGGYVPTRRPISSMVGNGIVIVGDAACQVNPIHGGGIGPSMRGGTIAGETITQALDSGEVSRDALWQYNVRYMQSYGAKQAGLDVFRLLLQKLRNPDLDYGLKHHLITKEDLLKTSMGADLRLNITEKTRRVFKGIGKLSLLRKLVAAARLMKKLKTLYKNYPPSPTRFQEWKEKTQRLIDDAAKL